MLPPVRKKKRIGRKLLALLVVMYAVGYTVHSFLPGRSHQEPPPSFLEALDNEMKADSMARSGRQQQAAAEPAAAPVAQPAETAVPEKTIKPQTGHPDLHGVSLTIRGSFFTSLKKNPTVSGLSRSLGVRRLADMLCSHVQRPLVWHGNPVQNSLKGDRCAFVFRVIDAEEKKSRDDIPDDIEIMAVRFQRAGSGRIISMYAFTASDRKFSKFYYSDGTRVEPVLSHGPLREYIQMTAPFAEKRRYRHQGADFKTPIGTPLYAPFSGVVSRVNWTTKRNGTCLEITLDRKPYTVKMLHLDRVAVKRRQTVKRGQLVAYSGNTGRSSAPHLHYQVNMNQRGRAIDPFKFHKTHRNLLPAADIPVFSAKVKQYDRLMDGDRLAIRP